MMPQDEIRVLDPEPPESAPPEAAFPRRGGVSGFPAEVGEVSAMLGDCLASWRGGRVLLS